MSKYQYEDLPAELKKHREHKKYKTTPARMRHKYTGMDVFIDPTGKHAPKIVEINSSPMTAGMPMTNLRSDQVEDILREKGRITGAMPKSKSKEYKKLVRQPKNLMILMSVAFGINKTTKLYPTVTASLLKTSINCHFQIMILMITI